MERQVKSWNYEVLVRGRKKLDPITHGLIGVALSTLSGHSFSINDPVFLGATLGAMIPDLDIVAHLKGRLNYLLKHRGKSHSLPALGVMSLGLSGVLYAFYPETSWNTIFFWTLAGTLSHGLIDILNSFGAQLLWPFSKKKFTVDMITLSDPIIFLLFLIAALFSYSQLAIKASASAFVLSALYLLYKELGRQETKNIVMSMYKLHDKNEVKILPALYKPFSWNFLIVQEHLVRFGTIRGQQPQIQRVLPHWDQDDPYIAAAMDGALAEVFDQFTPYYHVVSEHEEERTVNFMDLRYWGKDDFLYTGQVLMNEEGEIAQETFYLFPNRDGILLGY
ncbi:metal-dependent hydrolase [Paradesulfitobacterium aromaticivorans]